MTKRLTPEERRARQKQLRRKRWRRFYRRYGIQLVLLLLLILVGTTGIVMAARALFRSNKDDPADSPSLSASADDSQQSNADGKSDQTDQNNPNRKDDNADKDSKSDQKTDEKDPDDSKPKSKDDLLAEAEALAAGYDYTGAVELLQTIQKPDDTVTSAIASYEKLDDKLVTWDCAEKAVPHVFFHSLIADPSRAFDGDYKEDGYNLYMTTIDEFEKILDSLYERGYVLVSPYDVATEVTSRSGSHMEAGEIRLPKGKKPLLMSQDDVNYYGYMIGNGDGKDETPIFANAENDGFASKIVIGADGYPTCLYMDADGNELTGAYDLVPLLENFIQEHPDFSYHGARAMLGITGYEGVLGYRTKPAYRAAMGDEAYEQEVEDAKAVAECLKEHGWLLVSHSYGHPAYGSISDSRLEADSDKWEDTVQPIIGETDILIYPYGSDIAGVEAYTLDNAKFKALYDDGYRYFFGVDGAHDWQQFGDTYYRGTRRNLDGYRMYHTPNLLTDFFDVDNVFDKARPTPVPEI